MYVVLIGDANGAVQMLSIGGVALSPLPYVSAFDSSSVLPRLECQHSRKEKNTRTEK